MEKKSENNKQSFIEKCYKDKHGKVVVFQSPNLPILAWFIFTVLQKIFSTGDIHQVFSILAFGSLFTWAWLELFSGTTYIRRVLGLLIIIFSVMNQMNK